MSPAAGIVLSAAPAMSGGALKPKCSAVGHEALGAERDPERGEDGVAGLREGDDERAAAVLAVGVLEVDAFQHGLGLHRIALLRVGDPGLQRARRGDHLERRPRGLQAREGDPREGEHLAGARHQRDDAAQAPAERGRPPPARPAARSSCAPPAPGADSVRLSTRAPATSSPPGVPSRRSSKIRSRPETPTSASAGTPSAASSSRRSGGIGPSWPTTWGASSEVEARSSPLASTVRSRASNVARVGIRVTRRRRSPTPSPGNTRARDQSMPSPVAGSTTSPATVPNARVGMWTGTR